MRPVNGGCSPTPMTMGGSIERGPGGRTLTCPPKEEILNAIAPRRPIWRQFVVGRPLCEGLNRALRDELGMWRDGIKPH